MSKTTLCTYPSCTRCLRCERTAQDRAHDRAELEGLRATVAAIERVAVVEHDLVIRRMCRNALEGRYPERRAA
jgi:hypothetical protein